MTRTIREFASELGLSRTAQQLTLRISLTERDLRSVMREIESEIKRYCTGPTTTDAFRRAMSRITPEQRNSVLRAYALSSYTSQPSASADPGSLYYVSRGLAAIDNEMETNGARFRFSETIDVFQERETRAVYANAALALLARALGLSHSAQAKLVDAFIEQGIWPQSIAFASDDADAAYQAAFDAIGRALRTAKRRVPDGALTPVSPAEAMALISESQSQGTQANRAHTKRSKR